MSTSFVTFSLSIEAYIEIRDKLVAAGYAHMVFEMTDRREAVHMDGFAITTPMLDCPDCAAKLQQTGPTKLKHIRHVN